MITVTNSLQIPINEFRIEIIEELKARLAFKNPAYAEALKRLKAMGKYYAKPYKIPERVQGWRQAKGILFVPRGCTSEVISLLNQPKVNDLTRKLSPVDFKFTGELKPSQEPAVQAILGRKFSTICSPTGSGKTVMGLYTIAQRKQPALIIVHTTALLKQWIERATNFLDISQNEIGIIGQGSRTVGKRLTIALVQTLKKCAQDVAPRIGYLIVDECHHTPASTFIESVSPFDCSFMLGLSATHNRRDGLTPFIYWYVGPLVYEVSQNALIKEGEIVPVEPIIRKTDFYPTPDIDPVWQRAMLIQQLTRDQKRNEMIVDDVILESREGSCIVLTDRVEHAETLANMICSKGVMASICHGGVPRPEQEAIINALNEGKLKILVATGQLLGEGFDCKSLVALFLATPIKFSGRLIQYLGRVARTAEGKVSARVYDYQDINVSVLMKAAKERMKTYKRLSNPKPTLRIK